MKAIRARIRGRFRRRLLFGAVALALPVIAASAYVCWPMDPAPYLRTEASAEVLDRHGRPLYAFLNGRQQWCFPVPLDEVGPRLIDATLAAEDGRFRRHPGVDPIAVVRAAWQNAAGRKTVSGASTLTMQVVKLRQGPAGSVLGKVRQALTALRLERRATKDQILEAYLNNAPYGQNLVGCEAAARRYFGKPARELTLAEAALLAGLPKAPTATMPVAHPDRARARRAYVLARMTDEGFVTAADRDRALRSPLGAEHHDYSALAPHLALRLKPAAGGESKIRTTLDAALQFEAERLVSRSIGNVRRDIGNAALVVVDVDTAEVLARVGSAGFYDTPGGGMVDACLAPRSPGSALKPFTLSLIHI